MNKSDILTYMNTIDDMECSCNHIMNMLKVGMLNEFEISYIENFLNREIIRLSYITKDIGIEILLNKSNDIITVMKYMLNMVRKIKDKNK
jgi:hypothetical protein